MQSVQYYRDYNGPLTGGAHNEHSALGLFFGLLFLGIVITVAYYLVCALAAYTASHKTAASDPLDIAKERYAKGEITKEELAEIKKELK